LDLAIELKDVTVDYARGKRALDGLSLSVKKGTIFGFLGPNGAGKSTTVKAILGLLRPSSGSVRLNGLPADDPRSRRDVGYLPEEAHYYRFLTPLELLDFYGRVFGLSRVERRRRSEAVLDLVGLAAVAKRPIRTFSKGMAQKIGLAQALLNEPRTLVLDEPTSGLDPLARLELRALLLKLRSEGRTVFFSSHELSEVELLCDTAAILKDGKLLQQGTVAELEGGRGEESLERHFVRLVGGRPS